MKRVLFVSENATLAQVVRLFVLAKSLPPDRYDVTFACSAFDDLIFRGAEFRKEKIFSLPRPVIEQAVTKGSRIYDGSTLRKYLTDDLRLLDSVKPDLVVGDLRWSLAVACPLRSVPCASLVNAYWSPFAIRDSFPLPEHPIVKLLGPTIAARYFPKAMPKVFQHFAEPLNSLRRAHGLPAIGSLQEVLTWGDRTLFPDVPGLVPLRSLLASQVFLGPVCWSPKLDIPKSVDHLGRSRPLVYVTLGSSGHTPVLPTLVSGLSKLDVDVVIATAGRSSVETRGNVIAVDYVPGDEMAKRAAVVISNGGSSTGWQALREGTPVIGIPFNLDQYLASQSVDSLGAGETLRSGTLTTDAVATTVSRVVSEARFRLAAQKVAEEMRGYDPLARFRALVDGG